MNNQVVQLEPADLPALRLLMEKSNLYSKQKSGEYLWRRIDVASKQVKGHLLAGHVYGIKDGRGTVTAMIALADRDTYIWDDQGLDGHGLYLHKLMKDPVLSVPGVGHWLIGFAASQAHERNKVLRCDTKPSLEKLVRYYEKIGFKQVGKTVYPSTKETAIKMEANPEDVINRIRTSL